MLRDIDEEFQLENARFQAKLAMLSHNPNVIDQITKKHITKDFSENELADFGEAIEITGFDNEVADIESEEFPLGSQQLEQPYKTKEELNDHYESWKKTYCAHTFSAQPEYSWQDGCWFIFCAIKDNEEIYQTCELYKIDEISGQLSVLGDVSSSFYELKRGLIGQRTN